VSKNEKLLAKLLNEQMAFTWPELVTLLRWLGYTQIEGAGSRVKFDIGDPSAMITLHRPHPGNELKHYIRRQIIEQLKSGGWVQWTTN
jgi:predicted RNA binding protein YcfA (HicA-like mRNA interferase family)